MANQEYTTILLIFFSSLVILSFALIIVILSFIYGKRILATKVELETIKLNHEKALLATQLEIQEETFLKISREIHDNISLGLTLAKLQLNTFLDKKDNTDINLYSTIDLISKSLIEMNDLSKSLDGEQMLMFGLNEAIESEVGVIASTGIYSIEYELTGEIVFLNPDIELILLRIIQESLNNILKHARARTIVVELIFEEELLRMKISDDGRGFDLEATKARRGIRRMAGLKNLEDRVKSIAGELDMFSIHGVGTTINIKLPINERTKRKVTDKSSHS
jgi:signal transduction histidine kinase